MVDNNIPTNIFLLIKYGLLMQIELPIHYFYHINFFENTGFFSLLIRPVELGIHRNIFIELHFVCIELFFSI